MLDKCNGKDSKKIKAKNTEKRARIFFGRFFYFTTMRILLYAFYLMVASATFYSCDTKIDDVIDIQEYTGPIHEVENGITYYSDSAVVKMKMISKKQLKFANGDDEFPEGLFLEFFDEKGEPSSTLKADYCYYTKKEDRYKVTGNVMIRDYTTGDRLDTEELFWNPKKEDIFTDKFVRIEKDGKLHMGEGLEAKQDLSFYRILKPTGTL